MGWFGGEAATMTQGTWLLLAGFRHRRGIALAAGAGNGGGFYYSTCGERDRGCNECATGAAQAPMKGCAISQIVLDAEAGQVSAELARRGIPPHA